MPVSENPKEVPHPWRQSEHGPLPMLRGVDSQDGTTTLAAAATDTPHPHHAVATCAYAELQVTTNFTFLTGAGHPEEFVQEAARLGYRAVAITDHHSLAGIVRAHVAAKEADIGLAIGTRVDVMMDGVVAADEEMAWIAPLPTVAPPVSNDQQQPRQRPVSLLLYPTNRAAYARLCRLLTVGKRRAPKGECYLGWSDVVEHQEGLLVVVVPPSRLDEEFRANLLKIKQVFNGERGGHDQCRSAESDRVSLASSCLYGADDRARLQQLQRLARDTGVPLVATNDVHYHVPQRRALQDIITCIRHGCTVEDAGHRLFPHAERYLKAPDEMARLFAECPEALARSVEIAERAANGFSLDQLKYEYPEEICPAGQTVIEYLTDLTWRGAAERYPWGVPDKVRSQIEYELELIDELAYAPYFLTVYDLVEFARQRKILCQGRGAAANSSVCYCLGVTAVDPSRIDMLFERFISKERDEPPDIDIDFEHERREEVIQYIYEKYGRDRAALTAEVITYRGRSAVREVGKALGLSLDCVDRLSEHIEWWESGIVDPKRLHDIGLNPEDATIRRLMILSRQLLGFPRHLSQHVGGFVITRGPLCELVPIENAAMEARTVIEWDKDDIDAMGMLKVDVLGLGMLTCIRKGLEFLNAEAARNGANGKRDAGDVAMNQLPTSPDAPINADTARDHLPLPAAVPCENPDPVFPLQLHTIPAEDPAVYDMLCHADTVGVFQIESRAQMSMLPRLRPRCYYDLVIEVAIVRPGPIQGDMVHPYLRRRNGEEEVTYPNAEIERVLSKTLGVPLFQEQAMALSIVAAGFTPGEADQLRRAMAAWKRKTKIIYEFGRRIIQGMMERGYEPEFAQRCFEQIKGFSEYGFPESHAASFALLVYVSAWLKMHHPAVFAAALINSQPMGFYAPAQIVRDAQEHGVEIRPVDVNHSGWDCRLEYTSVSAPTATESGVHPQRTAALRLGMRLVKGLHEEDGRAIEEAVRRHGCFRSIEALWRASGVRVRSLRCLAKGDAFGSVVLDRQAALWHIRRMHDESLPLFDEPAAERDAIERVDGCMTRLITIEDDGQDEFNQDGGTDGSESHSGYDIVKLPPIDITRQVAQDYGALGMSLREHPVSFVRDRLNERNAIPAEDLRDEKKCPGGRWVGVAGLVLVRQRPGTASGIVFMTLEDETGIANLIVRPTIFDRFRKAARHSAMILAQGRVERQGEVVHVMVSRIDGMDEDLIDVTVRSRDFH